MLRWVAAIAVVVLCACGSKPDGLPAQRPADLHVRYLRISGQGEIREIVIDADGTGVLKKDEFTDAFEVTADELDALWATMREAHLERLSPPPERRKDVADAGSARVDVSFGVRTITVGAHTAIVDPIEALAKKVETQSE